MSVLRPYQQYILPLLAGLLAFVLFGGLLFHHTQQLGYSLLDAGFSILLLAVAGAFFNFFLRNYLPAKNQLAYALACISVISTILYFGSQKFLYMTGIFDGHYLVVIGPGNWLRFAFILILVSFELAYFWYRSAATSREKEMEMQGDMKALAREAELNTLRQKIQPHFLFNSLNSINSLLGSRPDEARNMIQKLSAFLRSTLSNSENEEKTLAEEMEHLQLYLDIEDVRFGHRLKVEFDIDELSLPIKVPFLILQPVIENAIKFGLYGNTGEVVIRCRSELGRGMLKLEVSNPVDAESGGQSAHTGTGFGLGGIQRRLYLLYGRTDLLKTARVAGDFVTSIFIPITA